MVGGHHRSRTLKVVAPIWNDGAVTVFHISGGDARLVSARLTDLVAELIGDGDRGSLFESHDLADSGADDKASVVATAVMGVQTESLFGDKRVVHDIGNFVRFEHCTCNPHDVARVGVDCCSISRHGIGCAIATAQHRSVHPLRTQTTHPQAACTVGNREPLGECDGGMLGDGIR